MVSGDVIIEDGGDHPQHARPSQAARGPVYNMDGREVRRPCRGVPSGRGSPVLRDHSAMAVATVEDIRRIGVGTQPWALNNTALKSLRDSNEQPPAVAGKKGKTGSQPSTTPSAPMRTATRTSSL